MIALVQEKPKSPNKPKFERKTWEDIALYDFVLEFWPVIEPGKPFVEGKHIRVLCLHLEAVFCERILRLIVNMPPRFAKSSIVSVLFRVWCWVKKPSTRFLCASYALSLATRDNVKCRRLILSPKFQHYYGHLFTLTKDQNAKIKFENDQHGASQAVSVGSSATGEGFDIGIIDDAHAIDENRSDITREGTIAWFKDTWCSRLNDPLKSAMIVVGQRVHKQDLSGYILEGQTGEHWVHLNLAVEYDPGAPCRTYYPDDTELWHDWRTEEGELLWPQRFPQEAIDRAKQRHGPLGYAALYQQQPVPPGGYVFNERDERLFTIDTEARLYLLQTPDGTKPVKMADCWLGITSDVAISKKQQSDYTVFSVWAVTPHKEVLLLYVFRDHLTFPEQATKGEQVFQEFNDPRFLAVWFEAVGYQSAIGQTLITKGVPCLPFDPEGDKLIRATGASIWMSIGNVYFLKGARWLEEWRKELYFFPMTRHDDQVDTLSMIVIIVKKRVPLDTDGTQAHAPQKAPTAAELQRVDAFQWIEQHGGWG